MESGVELRGSSAGQREQVAASSAVSTATHGGPSRWSSTAVTGVELFVGCFCLFCDGCVNEINNYKGAAAAISR